MDWNFLRKLIRIFLGAVLILTGLGLMVWNISLGFELSFAFLGLLVLLAGGITLLYAINSLSVQE